MGGWDLGAGGWGEEENGGMKEWGGREWEELGNGVEGPQSEGDEGGG